MEITSQTSKIPEISLMSKSYEKRLRRLTPRECLRLMGFDDSFEIVVSDTQTYRQAGNSIVVDVLEAIFANLDRSSFE